ncbi:MAG: lipase [Anaerolineae bacterium]|nr:lipase [Anaerolineae bacterium]
MKQHPVLLVHGIDDNQQRLKRLRHFLIKKGLPFVFGMDILPPDASIGFEVMAEQVKTAAEDLAATANSHKIDIVAYSMGTLAVRYFLQRLGGKKWVRRFISIAGPHHGTYMAYLRQNRGCRQMRPGSSFLNDLNLEPLPWGQVEVFSFWSPLDLMIIPPGTSRLAGAINRLFWVPAHPLTVSDPHIMKAVWQALVNP